MKRPLRPEEARLWATVVATVQPAFGRTAPELPTEAPTPAKVQAAARVPPPPVSHQPARPAPRPAAPERIEPGRKRRIAREREPIEQRLDLHGFQQDRAREVLHDFIARAHDGGARAVLIITGKGVQGDGVLRRRVPEWLSEPPSRARVAGISTAERRHGGEGALYVALKRKGR